MGAAIHDRFYFLPKDPHWSFLWWELSPETIYRLGVEMGRDPRHTPFWLRIHDVTDILFDGSNSHGYFDVAVTGYTDHWYLHLPDSNRVYCAEAGFRTEAGRFFPAVRSNALFLPRDRPSDRTDECWSTIGVL
jgi:hypothetical protein